MRPRAGSTTRRPAPEPVTAGVTGPAWPPRERAAWPRESAVLIDADDPDRPAGTVDIATVGGNDGSADYAHRLHGPDVGQWATEHRQAITTGWLDRVGDPEALDGLPAALRGHADSQLAAGPGGRSWKAAFGARFDDLPPPHRAALIAGAEHGGLHDIDRHVRGVAADLTRQRRELGEHAADLPAAALRAGEARWARAVEHAVQQAGTPGRRGEGSRGGSGRGTRPVGHAAHEGPSDPPGPAADGPEEPVSGGGDDDLTR